MLGHRLLKVAGTSANHLHFLIMSASSGVSAFMNNTTVTAMLLPPVVSIARRAKLSPSKLLMSLAFASILGGTCTLIGTSTNVAVSGYIKKAGMGELGMFEITPIGLVIVAVGVAYMMLVGRWLLPDHKDTSLATGYAIREYLSEIMVMPNSPLIGQRSFESDIVVSGMAPFGTWAILAGFFVLTIILTQPMSNAAAALVVLPIAIETANKLGASPRSFAIGIMLAASVSFIAPFEPSCILVFGPGKYKFVDFVKVGVGLTVVLAVVVLLLLPVFWPLVGR